MAEGGGVEAFFHFLLLLLLILLLLLPLGLFLSKHSPYILVTGTWHWEGSLFSELHSSAKRAGWVPVVRL